MPPAYAFAIVDATADLTVLRRRRAPLGAMAASTLACAPDDCAGAAARVEDAAVDQAADGRRKHVDVTKVARVAGPQRLVGLGAPQHVEFGGPFFDRRTDRQRHQD